MVSTVTSDRILLGVAINRSKENKWREIYTLGGLSKVNNFRHAY